MSSNGIPVPNIMKIWFLYDIQGIFRGVRTLTINTYFPKLLVGVSSVRGPAWLWQLFVKQLREFFR